MDVGQWLEPGDVLYRPSVTDKRQALTLLAEHGARAFRVDGDEILRALLAREADGSTGVGQGVALPHAQVGGLTSMRAMLVRLDQPVAFSAVDDRPVDLLFALLAPPQAGSEHLRALARASRLLRGAELREQLRQARSAEALYSLVVQDLQASAA